MSTRPPDPSTTRWYRAPDGRMWWHDGNDWVLWNRALGHPPLPKTEKKPGPPGYQQFFAVVIFILGILLALGIAYEIARFTSS